MQIGAKRRLFSVRCDSTTANEKAVRVKQHLGDHIHIH